MKISVKSGKLRLKFFVGTGFLLFLLKRQLKSEQKLELPVKEIKKYLKQYKRTNGKLTLVEVDTEDAKVLITL